MMYNVRITPYRNGEKLEWTGSYEYRRQPEEDPKNYQLTMLRINKLEADLAWEMRDTPNDFQGWAEGYLRSVAQAQQDIPFIFTLVVCP